ncbi:class Ib ribonucleoside-diphosphate reductase assembly flavoprotein NrdI [Paenibacillus chitinolyticus]|uniref:class Ib ribonucleoside-diphosphate reductase assembly flavoprotein NrdI n=1 Tax=Paenibacillus chitinolyticus TaxID=79263 RepID=UPI003557514E
MIIIYDSKTGNVERFVKKLNLECYRIVPQLKVSTSFILVTYTTGFGEVSRSTKDFLEANHVHLKGVASSGNRNWGVKFAKAADIIADTYKVPAIIKFELSGTEKDVAKFMLEVMNFV